MTERTRDVKGGVGAEENDAEEPGATPDAGSGRPRGGESSPERAVLT